MSELLLPLLLSAAAADPDAGAPDVASQQAPIVPPRVVQAPSAVYPPGHAEDAEVDLRALVDATGQVAEVEITKSGGPDFDAAARTAVLQWHFEPAKMSGVPFAARIRIPFVFHAPLAVDAGSPLPSITAVPTAQPTPELLPAGAPTEVSVRGALRQVNRGGSDFQIEVGQLATIAGTSPEHLLELAPGIFIANEGGAGHADQVFLRGFDAEQGQSIEFTVNGVPINQVDNTDGHGYADTHFIIPELVKNLRVVEGPFDPHQGNFAVAGSAEYELGVADRKLMGEVQYGSFNSTRALVLWAPEGEREGTFAAVQSYKSDGFGENRASSNASAMAQYEGDFGARGIWRLLATAYATQYKSAGVVRADDVANGIIDFYGTEDPSQGGDAQHYSLSFQLVDPVQNGTWTQDAFLIYNQVRIHEDFTGFLLDPVLQGQPDHPQRGDGILQQYSAVTAGGRGAYRFEKRIWDLTQALEVGYYARYDHTTPVIQRVLGAGAATNGAGDVPYEYGSDGQDLITDTFNIAGYVDLEVHPWKPLTLRGGVRQEYFAYNVLNLCELPNEFVARVGMPNQICGTVVDAATTRLPEQRATATALITEPKATALLDLPKHLTLTASYGTGAQSVPSYTIVQYEQAPFASINAGEGGVIYHQQWANLDASARAVYFYTHVGQDLIFNPDQGRLALSTGTTRQGAVAAARVTGRWFDESASFTYAYATFDDDHSLVPYVPNIVARSDTAVFGKLPWRLRDRPLVASVGLGLNYVGERALPLAQFAAPTFVMNASAKLRWSLIELSVDANNLTNARYPLSEFFYASDFQHYAYPTLAPVEHFTAAPPFSIMFGVAIILDKEAHL